MNVQNAKVAIFLKWNQSSLRSNGLSLDADDSGRLGTFQESRELRVVFGEASGKMISCIKVGLVGGNVSLSSIGGLFSVVPVWPNDLKEQKLFVFEVDYQWFEFVLILKQ